MALLKVMSIWPRILCCESIVRSVCILSRQTLCRKVIQKKMRFDVFHRQNIRHNLQKKTLPPRSPGTVCGFSISKEGTRKISICPNSLRQPSPESTSNYVPE
uniref:Uncharacterized protein n=1 Tax=Anguilla anguilla TaxID=7936 RepID=A0A0E9WVE4_ANGAN